MHRPSRVVFLAQKGFELRHGVNGRIRAVLGVVVGVGLLAAAIGVLVGQRSIVGDAFDSISHASPWLLAAAFAMPIVSWLSTSATFFLLSQRYARVPLQDMTALIGAAWLLNALPLRPGMVGRVAFHKKYHNMPIADSIRVMMIAMAMSFVSLVLLFGAAFFVMRLESGVWQVVMLLVPTAGLVVCAMLARLVGSGLWREVAALALKSIDMLSWVVRYAIVFSLMGQTLSIERVILVAAIGQIAMLVPVTGNGLGLREWVVGLTLAAFAVPGMREQATSIGLTADLFNRAAETVLSIPVGVICSAYLTRAARHYAKVKSDRQAMSHGQNASAKNVHEESTSSR